MSEEEAVRLAREVVEILYELENYDYINDSGAAAVYPSCRLILRSRTPGAFRLRLRGVPLSCRRACEDGF